MSRALAALLTLGSLTTLPLPSAGAPDVSAAPIPNARLLARPPFSYFLDRSVRRPAKSFSARLKVVSSQRIGVLDTGDWLRRRQFTLPDMGADLRNGKRGNLPAAAPETYGGYPLRRAIRSEKHLCLLYGPDFSGAERVLVLDTETAKVRHAFDFARFVGTPKSTDKPEFVQELVQWADVVGGTLYVSNYHRTYARSTAGDNGYLTALDLATGRLLWRSKPRVVNSQNFLIVGDALVCGYGFTDEPDAVYLLDRRTGKTLQELSVRNSPECLIRRGDRIHVQTYDSEYVLRLRAGK